MPRHRTKFVYCHRCGKLAPSNAKRFCSKACAFAERTKTPEERFWPKVNKNGPAHPILGTRCWLWTGSLNNKGYGQLSIPPSKPAKAHRVAWTLQQGPLPDGANVLHRCDVPACVNVEHLFLGTLADNNIDMTNKGRGRANVLTETEVRSIRQSKKTQSELGREFGVSQVAISKIKTGKTYRNLDVPIGRRLLTDAQVRTIRTSCDSQGNLASGFGVSQAAISFIQNRKTYKHVQ